MANGQVALVLVQHVAASAIRNVDHKCRMPLHLCLQYGYHQLALHLVRQGAPVHLQDTAKPHWLPIEKAAAGAAWELLDALCFKHDEAVFSASTKESVGCMSTAGLVLVGLRERKVRWCTQLMEVANEVPRHHPL